MVKTKYHNTYMVAGHYLSALIYGDISCFEADDEMHLEEFVVSVQSSVGDDPIPLVWVPVDGDPSFARCEVSGMGAMCHELSVWYV